MGSSFGIERRDPASGVLQLGSLLVRSMRQGRSGEIEVRDRDRVHVVRLAGGVISAVYIDGRKTPLKTLAANQMQRQVEHFFNLPRPHIRFAQSFQPTCRDRLIRTEAVVFNGVTKRRDLFDPREFVQRIPVETLQIGFEQRSLLGRLPLVEADRAFLERLTRPTPVSMILWKRGLRPDRAAALIMALNLLGVFETTWAPGDLPRNPIPARLIRMAADNRPDHELLGIEAGAPISVIDRAFRALSLTLHPDRLLGLPASEVARAETAFSHASQAYSRLKRSRRAPNVRHRNGPIREPGRRKNPAHRCAALVAKARLAALRGDPSRTRAYCLKALALSPHDSLRAELIEMIKKAA